MSNDLNVHPYNLGDLIPRHAQRDVTAVIALDDAGNETSVSFGELDDLSNAVARGLLRRGLQRGDRVAVLAANSIPFLALVLGVQRTGLVLVPVNYKFPRALSDYVIQDSAAKLVFCDTERLAQAPEGLPVVELDSLNGPGFAAFLEHGPFETLVPTPDEPAFFLYTSGTTGRPKGVVLSHQSHLWVVRTRLAGQSLAGQRYLIAAPLYHMNALALSQLALAGQASIVLLPQFKARSYIEAIARYQPTWLTSVPPMMAMVLRERDLLATADLSSVEVVRMGSAPVSEALLQAIRGAFPRARVVNSYGTTESGPVTFGPHPRGLAQPDMSIGHAHADVQVRLVDAEGRESDQGVLQVKSPGIMIGYHNRPEIRAAITADGYYITGDVMRRDAEGFYYFLGRDDDMFVCGGENIFPGEVEKVLETLPGVQQACVVPVPDDIKGHKPVAYIVATSGSGLTEEWVKQHALEHAPAYQHPRRVWFLDALPLASTNKVDRKLLQQRAIERLSETAAAH